jgi:hypothetical protein
MTELGSRSILDVLHFKDSDDSVILFDWEEASEEKVHNLARVTPKGEIAWYAELPSHPELTTGFDAYAYMNWSRGSLTANSLRSFWVELDPESGRIVAFEFTK